MPSNLRGVSIGITVLAAAVTLTACGSSNSGGPNAASTSTPSAPTTSSMATPASSGSATPSMPPTSSPSNGASAVSPCSSNIRVINGQSQGAAGHLTLVLIFNNAGRTSCQIYGYPGVDLVSKTGKTIAHAQRTLSGMAGGVSAVSSVTLAPGKSASALLEASDVPQGSITNCGSYSLMVTPPGEYVAVPAGTAMMPKCELQIHPVVAGTGGGMR